MTPPISRLLRGLSEKSGASVQHGAQGPRTFEAVIPPSRSYPLTLGAPILEGCGVHPSPELLEVGCPPLYFVAMSLSIHKLHLYFLPNRVIFFFIV